MKMAAEQMILKRISVGLLAVLCGIVGTTGLAAAEHALAPPEDLDLTEGLDSHQSFHAPEQVQWPLEDVNEPPQGMPVSRCCSKCGGGVCCPPNWYWQQNIRVLARTGLREIPLSLVQIDIPTNPVNFLQPFERTTVDVMNNRDLSFDIAAGYDTTIGHYLGRDAENRDQYFEFTFWGLNSWEENRRVNRHRVTADVGLNTYTFGGLFSLMGTDLGLLESDVGGFNRVETHYASYESDVLNFEMNVRIRPRGRADRLVLQPSGKWQRECQHRTAFSYLLGFRYLSLDEVFGFHGRGRFTDNGVTNPVSGDYDIRTHNDMFGPQVGADLMFHRCRYSFGVQGKVAPLVNFSDQSSTIVTDASADPLATFGDINDFRHAKNINCSLVGEVSILGNYRVRKNMVAHAGYHFVWITGLALASEQIQFHPSAADSIKDNGDVFYHGISGGLEWIW